MMDLSRTVFIGIDISSGRRGFTYAALDLERHLMALCQGDLQEIVAYTAGQSAAFAAIGGPPRPNQGLLAGSDQQEGLFPLPQGKDAQMRLAEHELAQKGITPARTPATVSACPGWMRLGFELYHHLQTVGYQAFPCEDAPRQYLETPPEAAYWSMLGLAPFAAATLESRLQRQLLLYEHGLPVRDSLYFLEEVTRHRLLKGILPVEHLHTPAELNALVLAYTAWLAANEPSQVIRMGDASEGEIVLPVAQAAQRRG
jgi:hypothetical protein